MIKKILSYGAVEGIAKGLNKMILLLMPFFIDTISFGKVGLLISLETLLPIITLLGFERAVLRFYSNKKEFQFFDRTVNVSVFITHFICLLFLILLFFCGVNEFFGLEIFPDLILLLMLVYFQSNNLLILNKLRVLEKHDEYFRARLILQVGKFLLALLLVYYTKSYLGYLVGGILITMLVNFYYSRGSFGNKVEKFSRETFGYLFMFSWPFIFHGIASNLIGNADKFILEHFMSLAVVGQYTFIYSLGSMIVFGFVGISIYLEPLIYRSNESDKEKYFSDYLFYGTCIFVLLFVCLSLVTVFVIPRFYKPEFSDVSYLIPLVAISFVLYPYYLTANYRFIYDKRTKKIAVLSILSCLLNILLNFIFIPYFGLYAAVLVTFVSYFLQALIFTFVAFNYRVRSEIYEIFFLFIVCSAFLYYEIVIYWIVFVLIGFALYLQFIKKNYVS